MQVNSLFVHKLLDLEKTVNVYVQDLLRQKSHFLEMDFFTYSVSAYHEEYMLKIWKLYLKY